MKISLAMIAKNEEEVLTECINSVKDIVDEVVLVDTGSEDNTMSIAEEMGVKLYGFKWQDDFSLARNFAAEKCSGDWILVLDADEIVEFGSRETLIEFATNNPNSIGKIEIYSKFMEGNEINFSKEYVSRFYPKGILYKGGIHEQLETNRCRINMEFKVNHSGYFKRDKSERNLRLLLKELENNPTDHYILYQIARTLHVAKRYLEADEYFEKYYKLTKGEYAYTRNFITLYIYNTLNTEKFSVGLSIIEEYREKYFNNTDFNFACGIFYMNLILSDVSSYGQHLYLIEKSYLRCLEIGEDLEDTVVGLGTFKAAYNLGVYYETTGDIDNALYYYNLSATYGYRLAIERIDNIDV
ncbi:glycosyltransferase family 2 protein [Clostridium sp.]|uniref:glycosyltransferase family 2 protein n=1 Tax=Clostridium sp. TaxID=1506 RepID=UPI003216504E